MASGSDCPMCHGEGVIDVREAVVGEAKPGGPKHLVAVKTYKKPCPLGCARPARGVAGSATLVGREHRVRIRRKKENPSVDGSGGRPQADAGAPGGPDDYGQSLGAVFGPAGLRSFFGRD